MFHTRQQHIHSYPRWTKIMFHTTAAHSLISQMDKNHVSHKTAAHSLIMASKLTREKRTKTLWLTGSLKELVATCRGKCREKFRSENAQQVKTNVREYFLNSTRKM